MEKVIILLIILCLGIYAVTLALDLWKHKKETKEENGKLWQLGLITGIVQFFATFGISDFSMSIPVYRGMKFVDDKRLPSTLITATVVPGAIISAIYITSVEVDMKTLVCCVAAHVSGTFLGVRLVSKLSGAAIKKIMGVCITIATVILLTKLLGTGASGGDAIGLEWSQLAFVIPLWFMFGALNMIGFGIKAPSMSILLVLGLSPLAVLPIVLSCCTFGSINGGVQFIKSGSYQRKIALASSTFGIVGVVLGANFVQNLNTTALQWIMVGIMIYTAWSMLKPEKH